MLCPLFTRQGCETKKGGGPNTPILSLFCVFIHFAVCLPKGPQPFPKRVFHSVRSVVSSFIFQDPIVFLRSSSSCLCLLSRLPVTSILLSTFPSITRFRRQFQLPSSVCKTLFSSLTPKYYTESRGRGTSYIK